MTLQAWDVAILVIAGYAAVIALVRLMRNRRKELIAQLQAEIASERQRQAAQRPAAAHAASRTQAKG